MNTNEKFHRYAAESVERAQASDDAGDRNIHLNMALAWVRLAHQSAEAGRTSDNSEGSKPDSDPPTAA